MSVPGQRWQLRSCAAEIATAPTRLRGAGQEHLRRYPRDPGAATASLHSQRGKPTDGGARAAQRARRTARTAPLRRVASAARTAPLRRVAPARRSERPAYGENRARTAGGARAAQRAAASEHRRGSGEHGRGPGGTEGFLPAQPDGTARTGAGGWGVEGGRSPPGKYCPGSGEPPITAGPRGLWSGYTLFTSLPESATQR